MTNKINWTKIMEDNREAIEGKIKQAKEETFETMQGWHVDVEIDEEGKAWTSDIMSTGSQSISSWNGETFIVCRINSWNTEINIHENIRYFPELEKEFEEQEEDGESDLYSFLLNIHPEILDEWEKDEKEAELSVFDPGEILDRAIEDQKIFDEE